MCRPGCRPKRAMVAVPFGHQPKIQLLWLKHGIAIDRRCRKYQGSWREPATCEFALAGKDRLTEGSRRRKRKQFKRKTALPKTPVVAGRRQRDRYKIDSRSTVQRIYRRHMVALLASFHKASMVKPARLSQDVFSIIA